MQLICQPSPNLANTTDASAKFGNLSRTATLDGQSVTGIFASDLTLAQVKSLRVNQSAGNGRDQSYNGQFQVSLLSHTHHVHHATCCWQDANADVRGMCDNAASKWQHAVMVHVLVHGLCGHCH